MAFVWLWCVKMSSLWTKKIPLTNNMWISRKQKLGFKNYSRPKSWIQTFEIVENISENDASKISLKKGGRAICIQCNNSYKLSKHH